MPGTVDLGPSESQTLSGGKDKSDNTCEIQAVLGILPSLSPHTPKAKDAKLIQELNDELDEHNKKNHTTI